MPCTMETSCLRKNNGHSAQSHLRRCVCLWTTSSSDDFEGGQKLIKCIAYTKPEEWKVLIKGHHEEYISWKRFEANQMILARNMATSTATATGAARQGEALLGGLLMCGHCGGKMRVGYPRTGGVVYTCRSKA